MFFKYKGENRRKLKRYPIEVDAVCRTISTSGEIVEIKGTLKDVSTGGVFVVLNEPPSLKSSILVKTADSRYDDEIEFIAEVIWDKKVKLQCGKGVGLGLKFVNIQESDIEKLISYSEESET